MIVVTGATGQLGGAVVERLLQRMPAEQVGVAVRDPAKAAALSDRGVSVRRGDFNEPDGLAAAFEGADSLLLVSAGNPDEDAAIRQHRAAVDAARAAGVGRIVYTSHMGVGPGSAFSPMRTHHATEAVLAESGVPWTSLRNGYYAATTLRLLGPALQSGVLAVPEDGPVSWTAHADLADAAALVLVEGGHDGPTPALTGGDALDLAAVADLASEVTGKKITRRVVSDQEHRETLAAHGTPPIVADLLIGMFRGMRAGEFAAVDPTLEKLIGRPTTSTRDVLTAGLPRT